MGSSSSICYYEDQLQAYWKQTPRPSVYIPQVKHEVDCSCCFKVPIGGNGKRGKAKK